MKILQMASNMKKNGPAMVVFDLSWGLAEMGHDVYIAAGEGELVSELKHSKIHFVHIPIDRVSGNRMKKIAHYSMNGISAYSQLKKLIHEKKIDIINSHQPISNLYAKRLSRICNIPFVTTSHNVYQPGFLNNTYVSGNHVIAVSEKVYDNSIVRFHVPKDKISCVPNGINPYRLVSDQPISYGDKFVIGTLAGLRKQKALDKMILAFDDFHKKVPDSVLVIAGEGEERGKLESLVNELGLGDAVDFLGFRNDSANVLAGLDIFTLSSEYEGLPISMLEAMAMKIPIVVTAVGGIPEVIHSGENGVMCVYGDIEGLSDAFRSLYMNETYRRKLSENGYMTIEKSFDYHSMARSYLKIYQSQCKV